VQIAPVSPIQSNKEREQREKDRQVQGKHEARINDHPTTMSLLVPQTPAKGGKTPQSVLLKRLTKNGLNPAAPALATPTKGSTLKQIVKLKSSIGSYAAKPAVKAAPVDATTAEVQKFCLAAKGAAPSASQWKVQVQKAVQESKSYFTSCFAPSVQAK
jgi:hypothetical protein